MKGKTLRLILGDQLNASHSWFANTDENTLYVIAELHQEANYTKHHIQKICAFFSAMLSFSQALEKAGHKVIHLTLDDTTQYKDLPALLLALLDEHQVSCFEYQLPDEYRLREQLREFSTQLAIQTSVYESEHFFLEDHELCRFFTASKKHRLEAFYRKMRVRFNILMDGPEPLGGQWNYDADNRQKLKPQDYSAVPEPLLFSNDVQDILLRLKRHNISTIGKAETNLIWPTTRQQAFVLLDHFCQYGLVNFGRFQDAMSGRLDTLTEQKQWSLYHSRLSFALNAKMISPQQVIDRAVYHFHHAETDISLAQIEGFVRQILGWREFVRGIYWANMPDYAELNFLTAQNNLPKWFWSGDTKMRCLSHAVKQSLYYAYAHHIQRLMVTGNFCLIAGIHPDQVDEWYLGIYIDAIEWVEMPNTRGMSQFADGGIVGSKAYAASGNYINKMSDYCGDCHYKVKETATDNACPLNSLYWQFMDQHQEKFSNNPRTKMVYANWLKKEPEARESILSHANKLLSDLDNI
ncbi:cryptochrome/photolyase family protein [Marinomonas sp. C2222]|uniref:Cryptochrome/photolyase family protein n=1 Tax=Marinomonas sargassi TaxID=2984494 RepID=A0ABT2YSS0_9GAMM|nr:cryptochrome/photolyase family protein [Marinomonas sargassi]MCV2402926.1 cryptochrome/photolyase family protein [Marinomonas sargassi]